MEERPWPISDIVKEIGTAGKLADPEDFDFMIHLAHMDDLYDDVLSLPALVMLPYWGIDGIDEMLTRAFKKKRKKSSLVVIACIALGMKPQSENVPLLRSQIDKYVTYVINEELQEYTLRKIKSKLLIILSDEFEKSSFFFTVAQLGFFVPIKDERISTFYYNLLIDSNLVINASILNKFENLLDKEPIREEELQVFLTDNPILIDPFTIELRSKHQLGDDFITDYVSRRVNDEYIIIEIESTTDKIFNKDGQLNSATTKALAQVRDFQAWVNDNIAYAQKKLPGIRRPEGIVIIGRDKDLSSISRKRLNEENYSRKGYIKIVTYDDLLNQAKVVYSNILSKPLVLKAKDQRVI